MGKLLQMKRDGKDNCTARLEEKIERLDAEFIQALQRNANPSQLRVLLARIVEEDKREAEEIRAKLLADDKKYRRRSNIFYAFSGAFFAICFSLMGISAYQHREAQEKHKEECIQIGNRFAERNGERYSLFSEGLPCYKFSMNRKDVYIIDGAGFVYSDGDRVSGDELKMWAKERLK